MPIIGSLDGTFGHGRSPQVAPTPGFTIYPPIGNRSSWIFASNGAFTFDGNVTTSLQFVNNELPNIWGNTFVITPNTNFFANVKIWGAGGGGGGNTLASQASVPQGGGGAAVYGQILFRGGQPYTFFAGGSGRNHYRTGSVLGSGGGGAASGIILGNVFAGDFVSTGGFSTERRIAIAGGGGGATSRTPGTNNDPVRLPSAGSSSESKYQRGEIYLYTILTSTNLPDYNPGNDTQGYGSSTPKQSMMANLITGTSYVDFTGGDATTNSYNGGGGGGNRGGGIESGGTSYVDPDESLVAVGGKFFSPGMADDPVRGRAGDSGRPGRISFFFDNEFPVSNITATGGTVSEVPIPGYPLSYRYHTFTSNDKFTITSVGSRDTIDIFAVGGGGGTGGVAGAGGGAVALRTNWPATVGNFIVTVGSGGLASDSYSDTGVGRIYGGYRGGDSAFFNNTLSALGFPDNYTRLIYSFNSEIRYINPRGDDSTGLTPTTAFTSFESARAKTSAHPDLLVFIVMSATYNPTLEFNDIQTPINDDNKPRVFVCVPSKVIINFSVGDGRALTCPMAMLQHPLSAVYGAIFVRTLNQASDSVNNSAFFFSGYTSVPISIRIHRGSLYNCVFLEKSTNPWALSYVHPDVSSGAWNPEFKIENCTFTNKLSNTTFGSVSGNSAEQRTLFKSCIFAANISTNGVLDNCLESQIVTTKYAVAGVNDKGVFGGEYSWGGTITAIERTARPTMIVARGGGGAPRYNVESRSPELLGGTSPGAIGTVYRTAYLQPSWLAGVDFSSYGHPGGSSFYGTALASGGGGAGGPGFLAVTDNTPGGPGFEWPRRSGVYYGAGGPAAGAFNIGASDVRYASNAGAGAGGSSPAAGNDGTVMVRYVVPGELTALQPPQLYNLAALAAGGTVTQTSTYRQHLYASSGVFYVYSAPPGFYLDLLVIGGGGGGSGNGHNDYSNPGYPGQVQYYRVTDLPEQFVMTITVGAGGRYGTYHEDIHGRPGSTTTVSFSNGTFSAAGGGGGVSNYGVSQPWAWEIIYPSTGTLITNGLYSDNTTRYAPTGGGNRGNGARDNPPNYGTYGSSGHGNLTPRNPQGYGWDDSGASGFAGAVFIRYSTTGFTGTIDD